MDEETKILIRNEVKRQLSFGNVPKEDVVSNLTVIIADMDSCLNTLKEFCESFKGGEKISVQQPPQAPKAVPAPIVKETHLRGKKIAFKEEEQPEEQETQSEAEDLGEEVDAGWVKTQDGDLEKGEQQIWKYGNHELVVWNDGRKYFAQVDGEKEEELWRQKDLEKIQRRIEKMP